MNKGTISMIVPDDEMPKTKDGLTAEVVLNPLGVINRLNIAQIIEQYINFMSLNMVEKLKEMDDLYEMQDYFFKFMKLLNKEQYDYLDMQYMMMSRAKRREFFDEIIEKGIYIHQTPFFGNTPMEDFKKIYQEFPELVEKYEFENIEKTMVMGDMYFIRLKHEASNKTSVRATGLNNIKNLPSKSTLKKEKKILVSQTPIRLGEMEVTNLMIPRRGDVVEKLLKSYSTSEGDRANIVADLLESDTPLKLTTTLGRDESINRQILQKYLNVLELDLED